MVAARRKPPASRSPISSSAIPTASKLSIRQISKNKSGKKAPKCRRKQKKAPSPSPAVQIRKAKQNAQRSPKKSLRSPTPSNRDAPVARAASSVGGRRKLQRRNIPVDDKLKADRLPHGDLQRRGRRKGRANEEGKICSTPNGITVRCSSNSTGSAKTPAIAVSKVQQPMGRPQKRNSKRGIMIGDSKKTKRGNPRDIAKRRKQDNIWEVGKNKSRLEQNKLSPRQPSGSAGLVALRCSSSPPTSYTRNLGSPVPRGLGRCPLPTPAASRDNDIRILLSAAEDVRTQQRAPSATTPSFPTVWPSASRLLSYLNRLNPCRSDTCREVREKPSANIPRTKDTEETGDVRNVSKVKVRRFNSPLQRNSTEFSIASSAFYTVSSDTPDDLD